MVVGGSTTSWMLEFAVLLGLAKVLEIVFIKIGLPKVLGYVVAGLLLSAMNFTVSDVIHALALLGIITLLFDAGLESSTREFFRGLKSSGIIAVGGVVGAILAGLATIPLLHASFAEAIAIGVIFSATSVSLTVKTLEELGSLNSREANAIVGAAVVDDVLGLALLSTLPGIREGVISLDSIIGVSVLAFAFWLAVSFGFQFMSKPLFKTLMKTRMEAPLITIIFIILMILSYLASYIKLSAILLAYAFGLGLASYPYLARRLSHDIMPIVALFTPLFFVYAGVIVELEELVEYEIGHYTYIVVTLILLAMASKVFGCYIAARLAGFTNIDSLIIGVGMMPRAEVMLTSATLSLQLGLIKTHIYTGVLMVLPVTALVVPILLKVLYVRKTRVVALM